MRDFGFRWSVGFSLLFVATLSFPYHVWPDIGQYVGPLFEPLVAWTGGHIFGMAGFSPKIYSDSPGLLVHCFNLAVLATVAGLVLGLRDKRPPGPASHYRFHAALSYYLALQLLIYGWNKVFKYQFYLPEPNTLFTPLGQLTPDLLYWSTVGVSYPYNVVAGLLEVSAGLLLLARRTRRLGALMAMTVLSHVVLIDFCYDISVKIYATFLLAASLVIAAPALKRIYTLLLTARSVAADDYQPEFRHVGRYAVAKSAVIGLMLYESLFPYAQSRSLNGDLAPRPLFHGAYEVVTFVRNRDTLPPLTTDTCRWRRFFIHSRGYFITQTMDDALHSYPLRRVGADFILESSAPAALRHKYDAGVLVLEGVLNDDTVRITARKLDIQRLPLLR